MTNLTNWLQAGLYSVHRINAANNRIIKWIINSGKCADERPTARTAVAVIYAPKPVYRSIGSRLFSIVQSAPLYLANGQYTTGATEQQVTWQVRPDVSLLGYRCQTCLGVFASIDRPVSHCVRSAFRRRAVPCLRPYTVTDICNRPQVNTGGLVSAITFVVVKCV